MSSDSVEAGWEACECDHVSRLVPSQSNIGVFSRRDPCKSCQSYSFLHVGVLDSNDCCGSASRQMLAQVAPDSVNKWQWS